MADLQPIDEEVDHVSGSAGGRVILEYGDNECPIRARTSGRSSASSADCVQRRDPLHRRV